MTMYLVISAYTSSPISLLVTTKASAFINPYPANVENMVSS